MATEIFTLCPDPPIALGSVIGSVLGARFLLTVSGDRLRLLFVVVIVGLAVQMLHAAAQGLA